jgi:hypothetical protein
MLELPVRRYFDEQANAAALEERQCWRRLKEKLHSETIPVELDRAGQIPYWHRDLSDCREFRRGESDHGAIVGRLDTVGTLFSSASAARTVRASTATRTVVQPPGILIVVESDAQPGSVSARLRTAAAASVVLVAALAACGPRAPTGGEAKRSVAKPAPVQVRTDLDGLARWLELPPGARAARWTVRARGVADPEVPGPTDTILTAYVEIDPSRWGEVERAMAPGGGGTLELEEAVALELVPLAQRLPTRDGMRVVGGPSHAAQKAARSPYLTEWAIRWHAGLVYVLYSR